MQKTTREEFADHLKILGVARGDRLAVHSRLISFGVVEGGVTTVLDVLQEAIGKEGTLVFPGYTLQGSDVRVFDPKETAPLAVGALSTLVFKRNEFCRSECPLHNHLAIGRDASIISKGDPTISFGEGSDFDVLEQHGFKMLLLGCLPSEGATFLHHMEAVAQVPYRLWIQLPRKLQRGSVVEEISVRYYANRGDEWHENFDVILPVLESRNVLKKAPTAYAESYLVSYSDLKQIVSELLKKDPYFLVKK